MPKMKDNFHKFNDTFLGIHIYDRMAFYLTALQNDIQIDHKKI